MNAIQDEGRWTVRLMEISVILCAVIVFASMLATFFYSRHLDIVRRHEQVASCERGNVIRTYLNETLITVHSTLQQIPLVDCEAAIS